MSETVRHALVDAASRFARELWVYLVLAALLTTIMTTSAGVTDMAQVSAWFVGNLLLSLSIAGSFTLAFALTAGARERSTLSRFARGAISALLFVPSVLVGVELGLLAIRVFAPTMASLFPHSAVLIVAAPVSLVMIGIGVVKEASERERRQHAQVERQLAETRLSALSARTDPHFLFNSLNSIVSLVDEDPRAAERAILSLSAMFRYVLDGSRAHQVKLIDELAFVRSYLGLEQLRYGERIHVTIDIDPTLEQTWIPPLLLQPLVENALRHGTSRSHDPVHIAVRAYAEGDDLTVSIDDDGPGPGLSQHRGSGSSHADLRARLELVYGTRASFKTGSSAMGGFRAVIRLPREVS